MSISNLVQQMLILLIYMVIGFIMFKTKIMDLDGNKKLSKFLLNVTQCAMILAAAMNSEISYGPIDIAKFFFYGLLLNGLLVVFSYGFVHLFRCERKKQKMYQFMCCFGNTGFMGFPVVAALFGSDAVLVASIFLMPFNILSYSVGILMVSDTPGQKMNLKVLINPAMICTLIAIAIVFIKPSFPYVITKATTSLGDVTVPGAMIVTGVNLGATKIKEVFNDKWVYLLCLIKLVIDPVIVWAICRFIVADGMYFQIMVILSAMPCAAIAGMFSLEYDGDSATSSRGIFITTVLSVITAPCMMYLLLMR